MSSSPPNSDVEGHEKPVREKLRNASISVLNGPSGSVLGDSTATAPSEEIEETAKPRGRPSKKRSHDDIAEEAKDEPATKSRHARKRSRDDDQDDQHTSSDDRTKPTSSHHQTSAKRHSSHEHSRTRDRSRINGAPKDGSPKRQTSAHKRPATPTDDDEPATTESHLKSPRTKKSRPDETEPVPDLPMKQHVPATEDKKDAGEATDEKEQGPQPKSTIKSPTIASTSGFANASAASPFSALAGSKSPTDSSAPSAFKASGFGALAASNASGFGSLSGTAPKLSSFASSSPSPLAASADAAKTEDGKPGAKTFGGALGASSPFAAAGAGTSAFSATSGTGFASKGKGGFGSGLGGGFGGLGGSKLGSFASSGTPGVIGGGSSIKPAAKTFGAPADDDEAEEGSGEDDDETGDDSKAAGDDEKDGRFYEQDSKSHKRDPDSKPQNADHTAVETGEENETTEYTCRAKLYNFVKAADGVKKEWKERGIGVIRLNVAKPAPGSKDTAPKARLLMRADGSHRVALNTPVVKGVSFGSVTGGVPEGGYVCFMGSIDGSTKLELLQMKVWS